MTVIVPALEIWPLMVLLSTLMPIPAAVLPGVIVPVLVLVTLPVTVVLRISMQSVPGVALVTGPLGVVTLMVQAALAGVWAAANSAATEVVASKSPIRACRWPTCPPSPNFVLVP